MYSHIKSLCCNWGLCGAVAIGGFDTLSLPHYRAFDIRVCQIPTIAPYNPEGGGGLVGQYIDRCIIILCLVNQITFLRGGAYQLEIISRDLPGNVVDQL